MKRKQIILVALAAALVVATGIAAWRLLSPEPPLFPTPTGLSAPIELVEIPPGEFMMGSPEDEEGREEGGTDETQHLVRITDAFKMGKYEVTQKQWREVMGITFRQWADKLQQDSQPSLGKRIQRSARDWDMRTNPTDAWKQLKWVVTGDKPWESFGKGDNHPMYFVSWDEAVEFCSQLTKLERTAGRLPVGYVFRLPTEAEWEYACRAGSTTRFANGDTEADLDAIGWGGSHSGITASPVGMKLPNAWGLYDMHGNIAEWSLDRYGKYPTTEVMDVLNPATGSSRVYRGGSWCDPSWLCRSATRNWADPGKQCFILGLRVVLAPVRAGE